MLQLQVLTGKQAGAIQPVPFFPCSIGRSNSSTIQFEEPGVWDPHVEIHMDSTDGLMLHVKPNATTLVNNSPVRDAVRLKTGDVVELGGLKLQVWLQPTKQKSFAAREVLIWLLLLAIVVMQAALARWLLR